MTRRTDKRLTILSKNEANILYGLPEFNEDERAFYFDLNDEEIEEINSLRSIDSRIHFILQLGYFKAKFMFFSFTFSQVTEDVNHVIKRYFPDDQIFPNIIGERVRFKNNIRILKLLSWNLFDQTIKEKAIKKAAESVKICVDPRYIFDDLLDFLGAHRIVIPGYSTLQDIISRTLIGEEERLQALIKNHLPDSTNQALQKMLLCESKKMYGVTILKTDAKGFNTKEMAQEIKKKLTSAPLFEVAERLIPKLGISEQNVCHYAYLVDYYTVDRLNELSYETVRLYLLCYIFYRFEKINDNLVGSFIYHTNIYKKAAKQDSKDKVYEHKAETNSHGYGKKIEKILDLFTDDNVPDGDIRTKGFGIVEREKFHLLKAYISHQTFDEEEFKWDYYEKIAKTISRNLRPLVRAIDFEGEGESPLMTALAFLKQTFNGKKSLKQIEESKFPTEFIPSSLKAYLYTNEQKDGHSQKVLNVYQYEFLIYYQLERALETGRCFVNNSFNFKCLKKDLYELWKTDKEKIIESLNNPILNAPIQEQLQAFKKDYNALLLEVNQRIEQGDNKEIKIKQHNVTKTKKSKDSKEEGAKEWVLTYPKKDSEVNNPFYDQFPRMSLNQVLRFVNQHCNFLKAFTHVKPRYSKTKADEDSILACITADATNYGIFQMGGLSDIGYEKLFTTLQNFIRLETLREGNDILVNGIGDLPIFKHWRLFDDLLISSTDGKKVQTRFKHILARHSSKYFGQKRGVVSLSMVLNNTCTNTKIIPASDHESHHFFDLNFHNTSDIQPDWSCGDTHSINRLNFCLLPFKGAKIHPSYQKY